MDIQNLRYLVQIEQIGSINRAAQSLYVSQSTLSRILKEVEAQTGITIFRRTNKGVIPTNDGALFLAKVKKVLADMEELDSQYFSCQKTAEITLLIATQRCSVVVNAFVNFYHQNCGEARLLNLVLQEEPTENILRLVANRVCHLGVLHTTNEREADFLQMCRKLGVESHLLDESPVCAQVRCGHPLAGQVSIGSKALEAYPHVTYSDEDITKINYCSDIFQYNQNVVEKRIIVQDRGTLLQVIGGTDGYYLGCDWSHYNLGVTQNIQYIPLNDTNLTIKTYWIQREGYVLMPPEQSFIEILRQSFHMPD